MFKLEKVVVGPFQCNCSILMCPVTGATLLVDPGDEAPRILNRVLELGSQLGVTPKLEAVFHTHGHLDHIAATPEICRHPVASEIKKVILHKGDIEIYQALRQQAQFFGLSYGDPEQVTHFCEHEENFQVGKLGFSVMHTPGHSPGSVCLRLSQDTANAVPEVLFTGDTLFQGSVGRTDLWGGDQAILFKNIKERIFKLEGEIPIHPGHGPTSTIGIEKRENPFVGTNA